MDFIGGTTVIKKFESNNNPISVFYTLWMFIT